MSKKAYGIILISLILFSCHRNESTPNIFTESSYPLAVGDWWQYQLTSCTGGSDTFMLSVFSMTIIGPYARYQCNVILNGTIIDSGYFLQSDTSMSFTNTYYPYYSVFPNFHLKFPVALGQHWAGAFPGDSILVGAVVDSLESYHHTYGPCYLTNESYDLPHNFLVEHLTLTPKIGLVSQTIDFISDTAEVNGFAGVNVCQSLQLINYNLK
jgi:hypothetical protein